MSEDQTGLEQIDLAGYPVNREVSLLVARQTCEKFLCVPLEFGPDNSLHVAISNPLNQEALRYLELTTGKRIAASLASEAEILEAMDRIYDFGRPLEEIVANVTISGTVELMSRDRDASPGDSRSETVRQIFKTVLGDAVAKGATDVHMEPRPAFLRIRIRVDDLLHNLITVPKWLQPQVTACTKLHAGMDIAQKREPQEGALCARIAGRQVDFRVSTLPTPHGEKVVIRVMDKAQKRNGLSALGLPAPLLDHARALLQHREGMILAAGPSGSGRTTLLYALLAELKHTATHIVTVEDPIEQEFEDVTQTQINEKAGLGFADILRSVLRQSPDVIMVGEIRDPQTAQTAFRAARAGLVLSSVHGNGATAAVRRLVELGIEPYTVSSTVLGIFGQRLLRRNCRICLAEDKTSDPSHVRHFRKLVPAKAEFLRGRGCNACTNTGYRGRMGAYELLRFTPAVVDAINAGVPEDRLVGVAIAEGMTTLADECARLVSEGLTSVSEAAGIVGVPEAMPGKQARACPACGRYISADFLVCPYCRHKLPHECPKCASPVEQGWRTCPRCMTLLNVNGALAESAASANDSVTPRTPPDSWVRASLVTLADPAPADRSEKPRVLIVDDEAPIRKAVTIILKQIGCEVLEAADGGDALDKAEIYRPDLIISDINMPVMDGYQLCKQVRKSLGTAFIPFIMLTSRDSAADKLKGFMHGTDDYLTKPFDYRELQARVKRLLARMGHGNPGDNHPGS